MKIIIFAKTIVIFFIAFALAFTTVAQENAPQPVAFSVGSKVKAYIFSSGRWFASEIVELVDNGRY